MKTLVWAASGLVLFCALALAAQTVRSDPTSQTPPVATAATTLADQPTATPSPTLTPIATATFCPMATPEPLWVDPVTSPTGLLTQTITVFIGHGEAVTVTTEAGAFSTTGSFDAFANPARVDIALLPEMAQRLLVQAKVSKTEQWGCPFGGYVLSTRSDRYGGELLIVQQAATPTATATAFARAHRLYLPVTISP